MGFDIIYTFGSDNETSSLICMIEMWAILHHTFILFYGNFFFKARHWRNCSLEWTQETPSSGIYFSLGQSKIDNSWREVRSWRPFLSRDLRFWNSFIGRVLRLVEVLPGKHFSSLQSWQDNNNWLGDYSLCKPTASFWQWVSQKYRWQDNSYWLADLPEKTQLVDSLWYPKFEEMGGTYPCFQEVTWDEGNLNF